MVERLVRDQEVAGSNPVAPTISPGSSKSVNPASFPDTLTPNELENLAPLSVPGASIPDPEEKGSASVIKCKTSEMVDPDLERLAALWPKLSAGDRAAILALATSLAGC